MAHVNTNDVQGTLDELDQEEQRIMQELMEIDEADYNNRVNAAKRQSANPRAALNALLAECEKEVRSAKGYIASPGPPLRIARCKPQPGGGGLPKYATFLSRPKDTGVDFTVAVTLPEYLAVVKNPIFLNTIRDKCKTGKYNSSEDYLDDMRLLARNTAAFNKGEEQAWVVQHAKLLLEAAVDAVNTRGSHFFAVETALRQADAAAAAVVTASGAGNSAVGNPGKRKRSGGASAVPASANGSNANIGVGARLSVLWHEDQTWYSARVVKKPSTHKADVEYDDDRTRQLIDLRGDKWRLLDSAPSNASVPASSRGRTRGSKADRSLPPPNKRQKSNAVENGASVADSDGPALRAALSEMSEMLANRIEEVRLALLADMNSRFDRLERSLLRSDALRRVLLSIEEIGDGVTKSQSELQLAVTGVESKVEELREKLNNAEKPREATGDAPRLGHAVGTHGLPFNKDSAEGDNDGKPTEPVYAVDSGTEDAAMEDVTDSRMVNGERSVESQQEKARAAEEKGLSCADKEMPDCVMRLSEGNPERPNGTVKESGLPEKHTAVESAPIEDSEVQGEKACQDPDMPEDGENKKPRVSEDSAGVDASGTTVEQKKPKTTWEDKTEKPTRASGVSSDLNSDAEMDGKKEIEDAPKISKLQDEKKSSSEDSKKGGLSVEEDSSKCLSVDMAVKSGEGQTKADMQQQIPGKEADAEEFGKPSSVPEGEVLEEKQRSAGANEDADIEEKGDEQDKRGNERRDNRSEEEDDGKGDDRSEEDTGSRRDKGSEEGGGDDVVHVDEVNSRTGTETRATTAVTSCKGDGHTPGKEGDDAKSSGNGSDRSSSASHGSKGVA